MCDLEKARKIRAIVVSYNPDLATLDSLLGATRPQVDSIIVVDNGSDAGSLHWLYEQQDKKRIVLLALGENLGIATGHNKGLEWAKNQDSTHVLLMDQDSIPDPNMVSALIAAEQELIQAGEKVAAVGPRYKLHETDLSSFFVRFGSFRFKKVYCTDECGPEYVPVDFLISSGCLISLKAVGEIGLLDESLFIDHVDTEWFFRARSKGYASFGICNAIMNHNLGDYLFSFWFGKRRTLPIHSPLRQYYIFRNSILLYKRPYASKKWIICDLIRLCQMFFFYSIRIPPRRQFCLMMVKGIYDGLRGRSGRHI